MNKRTTATLQLVLLDDSWYFQKNDSGTILADIFVGSHLLEEDAISRVRDTICPEDGFEVVTMYHSYNVPPVFDPRAAEMFDYFINQAYHDYYDSIIDIWMEKIVRTINHDKTIQALLEIEDLENDDDVDFWHESFTNYDRLVLLQEDMFEIREYAIKDAIYDRLEGILEDTLNELPIYMRNTIELAGMYWNKFKAPDECLTKWAIEELMEGKLYEPAEIMDKYEVVLDETLAQQTIDNFDEGLKTLWKYFLDNVLPEEYVNWGLRKKLILFRDWCLERLPNVPITDEEISQIQLPLSKNDFLRLDNSDYLAKGRNVASSNIDLAIQFLDRRMRDDVMRRQLGCVIDYDEDVFG